MQVIERIAAHHDELTAIRRDIHAHPEIGFHEKRTSALVAEKLKAWGVDEITTGIGGTGLVGVIRGTGPGPTVGLRADMDALPMTEETNLPYASKNPGAFHGCGHDGHTAMLLGAARYLAETRNFKGTVHLIFQPAEEGWGGALAMLKDGLFERFPCDEIYAIHNWPNANLGWVGTTPGVAMAASNNFDIEIVGKGAHGAMPQQANDPVVVAVAIAQALQTIVSRNVEPLKTGILSVTQIHAGSAYNVIPESAALHGTLRSFDNAVQQLMIRRLKEIAQGLGQAFGVTVSVKIIPGFNALANSPAHADAACAIARRIVGEGNVDGHAAPLTGSEDFADMLLKVPGAYLWLGQSHGPNLHNPKYNFNDAVLPIGASLYARLAEERLAALAGAAE
ncbi:MAG TPA: M20 aminoacylase family protein [Aestuariivirga sp.]|nr:M20 aminoacylase family protein [Aestuariivirga sp.]